MDIRHLITNLWRRSSGDPNPIGGPNPVLSTLTRMDATPTSLQSIRWKATFSQVVTGVNLADFTLVQAGGVSGASLTSVTDNGDSKNYTVTADSGISDGTLGLNFVDDDSVTNGLGQWVGGFGTGNGNKTGQVYTVTRTTPPPAGLVFGASYNGDPVNISGLLDAKWGISVGATRTFCGSNASTQDGTSMTPYKWNTNAGATKNGLTPDRHNIISWKPNLTTWNAQGAAIVNSMNAWFDGAPTNIFTDLTLYHETDRPPSNSGMNTGGVIDIAWQHAMQHLITLVNNFGNPSIRVGVILTAGGSDASINRRWDWNGTQANPGGYLQSGMKWVGLDFDGTPVVQTYPGAAALTSANWYGWFNNVPPPFMSGGYTDIPNILAAGYDVIVPEWSWHKAAWDVPANTGQHAQYYRSLVYTKAARLLKNAGVTTVTYWDNVGSTNVLVSGDPDFTYVKGLMSGSAP